MLSARYLLVASFSLLATAASAQALKVGTDGSLTPNDPPFINASSKGAGPRHFVFTPKRDGLWLINEKASTLPNEYKGARFDKEDLECDSRTNA